MLWAVEQYTFGYATHINLVSTGFRSYFGRFNQAMYSGFTNGIDDEFLSMRPSEHPVGQPVDKTRVKTIL